MQDVKPITYVPATEQKTVSRSVLAWLKEYQPEIEFEYLPPENSGISMTTVQGAYKTAQYIDGSYEAQYQFGILYRSLPTTSGERLDADSLLSEFGEWMVENPPEWLGENNRVTSVEQTSAASLVARYEDLTEDYQILMTIAYEVEV